MKEKSILTKMFGKKKEEPYEPVLVKDARKAKEKAARHETYKKIARTTVHVLRGWAEAQRKVDARSREQMSSLKKEVKRKTKVKKTSTKRYKMQYKL